VSSTSFNIECDRYSRVSVDRMFDIWSDYISVHRLQLKLSANYIDSVDKQMKSLDSDDYYKSTQ